MEKPSERQLIPRLQPTPQPSDAEIGYRTVEITHGALNRRLKEPVVVRIPSKLDRSEEAVYRYVIDSLRSPMPKLVSFAIENRSILNLAKYYLTYGSGSRQTLGNHTYAIKRFCKWSDRSPDQLIAECQDADGYPDQRALYQHRQLLENWIGCLKADELSPNTIASYASAVKALYEKNGLKLELQHPLKVHAKYEDRAPRPDELQQLIDIANLRGKVIVSCLALGGFREGTLAALRYHHVREDIERGVTPVHVHIEAEITKGKYHDYDTFLGREAVDFIQAYLTMRRRGSPRGYTPPEEIHDDSPLIRSTKGRGPRPLTRKGIYQIVHNLYHRADLLRSGRGKRYALRPHSIRKFFRTQLAALGVDSDYIDYMMGHTISTYHDIQMKGVEFLRNVYIGSGLSIRPKTKMSKIEQIEQLCVAWGLRPNRELLRRALSEPHRVYASSAEREEDYIRTLRETLKEAMRKELLKDLRVR